MKYTTIWDCSLNKEFVIESTNPGNGEAVPEFEIKDNVIVRKMFIDPETGEKKPVFKNLARIIQDSKDICDYRKFIKDGVIDTTLNVNWTDNDFTKFGNAGDYTQLVQKLQDAGISADELIKAWNNGLKKQNENKKVEQTKEQKVENNSINESEKK